MIEYIKWFFIFTGLLGAYEGSKKKEKCNARKMNIFYFITNVFSIVYFFLLFDWAYLVLYIAFLIISILGIIRNDKNNKKTTKKRMIK